MVKDKDIVVFNRRTLHAELQSVISFVAYNRLFVAGGKKVPKQKDYVEDLFHKEHRKGTQQFAPLADQLVEGVNGFLVGSLLVMDQSQVVPDSRVEVDSGGR